MRSRMISKKVRQTVIERAGELCEYCRGSGDFRGMQMAHIIPKSLGGSDNTDNLLYLCARCHFTKLHHLKEAR